MTPYGVVMRVARVLRWLDETAARALARVCGVARDMLTFPEDYDD